MFFRKVVHLLSLKTPNYCAQCSKSLKPNYQTAKPPYVALREFIAWHCHIWHCRTAVRGTVKFPYMALQIWHCQTATYVALQKFHMWHCTIWHYQTNLRGGTAKFSYVAPPNLAMPNYQKLLWQCHVRKFDIATYGSRAVPNLAVPRTVVRQCLTWQCHEQNIGSATYGSFAVPNLAVPRM